MSQQFDSAIRAQKILVLDPSSFHRALASEALRAIGAGSIEIATSISEANDLARRFSPSIVVLEWDLDDKIDGIALTKMIRQGETGFKRDVAIVIATSRASMAAVETARIAGVDEYIIKPFSTVSLTERLEAIVLSRREFVIHPSYVGPCRRRKLVVAYAGARRRELDNDESAKRKLALSKVENLSKIVRNSRPVDRAKIRDLRKASNDVLTVAGTMDDKLLQTAAESLHTYLASAGINAPVDIKVVNAHVDAMRQVIALPNVEGELREQVARALRGLVDKKLALKSA